MTDSSENIFDSKINLFFSKEIYYFTLFFLIVLLYIYGKGQLTHTFARQDDWEFMTQIPTGMEFQGLPWDKTLWEGRWTNFLWSKIAVHLTLKEVFLFFILGYSVFCWIASSFISSKNHERLIITLLFFICPEYADLSLWPATLAPSVWLVALTLITYKLTSNKYLVFCFFILNFITYPPIAPIPLLFISLSSKNYKQFITFTILYFISCCTAVIIIYSLNYFFHGFFGLQLSTLRNPHPIKNIHDIIFNFKKASTQIYHIYFGEYRYAYFLLLSIIVSIILKFKESNFLKFFIILLLLIFIDFLIPIATGTDVMRRTILWPWFLIVSILFYHFKGLNHKYSMLLTLSCSLLLFIHANITWNFLYSNCTQRAEITEYYGKLLLSANQNKVLFCGNISKTLPFYNTPYWEANIPFVEQIWKEYNIQLIKFDHCDKVQTLGLSKINDNYILKVN